MNPVTPSPSPPSPDDLFTRLLTLVCDTDRGEDPFAWSTSPPPRDDYYRPRPAR